MNANCCDPAEYQIRVRGELDESWIKSFEGFTLEHVEGDTVLTGQVVDQSALHGLLARVGKLSLFLVCVKLIKLIDDENRAQAQENEEASK